ncbi:hypothetical protein PanWU01x14_143810 [Parasponia andersonii]|uniref:Uncharacterized protein n=1 Tax=Parasponia andersonii TaxID=3476 RepID=A0A2P5CKY8_PARAD|nr:hypothetical protein PanWU01x14_143810 [Parasponia andersonii]
MGDQICQTKANHHDHDEKILIKSGIVRIPFRIIVTTILSLVLPLAFLALARIACARFLLSQFAPSSPNSPVFFSVFLHGTTNPTILYLVVSTISIATLVHSITNNKLTSYSIWPPLNTLGPRPYAAWIFLWVLAVPVGLGIKGTVATGTSFVSFGAERNSFCRDVLFLGLHETMVHWTRLVVEPVVNDTIFGVVSRKERWVQRGVTGGMFVVLEFKERVKVIKGLVWFATPLFCRAINYGDSISDDPRLDVEEQV